MAHHYHFQAALLSDGWAQDVVVTVDDDGFISGVSDASAGEWRLAATGVERVSGVAIPGMANSHSHAFQRAMAGKTEFRSSKLDSFWTWRQAMYALANRIEPEDLQLVATQLFIEMLKAGYTSVAEFHYLHRRRDGTAYAGGNALWQAIELAADDAGIGLTLLPVLYQSSDFGGRPLKREQARFAMEADVFLRRIGEALAEQRRAGRSTRRTGAAFHSLRAVPLDILQATTRQLHDLDASLPIHIHIAEQVLEVQACQRETGRRPVELLLETGLVTPRWCLVHATHCTPAELRGIAETSAAVCVSISTEANLGDGFFDTARFLQAGGRLCVGSDSQSTVSPAEELRWLEYQQRLRKKRRVVLTTRKESHAGTRLWAETAECGARAIGQAAGAIAVGRRADWVVLDSEHPSMAGAAVETTLDHLLFAAAATAIRDVMVAGRWVVRGGRHPVEGRLAAPFAALMQRLALDSAPEPP